MPQKNSRPRTESSVIPTLDVSSGVALPRHFGKNKVSGFEAPKYQKKIKNSGIAQHKTTHALFV